MAFVAGQAGVFSDEIVAGFTVIKAGRRWCPLDQRKIHTVMIRMALSAPLTRARLEIVGGMQSTMCAHAGTDFGMALHALELSLPAELVAGDAMAGALQCLVGARQWPRRNL